MKRRNFILTAAAALVAPWQSGVPPITENEFGGFLVPPDIAKIMLATRHKGIIYGKSVRIDLSECRELTA